MIDPPSPVPQKLLRPSGLPDREKVLQLLKRHGWNTTSFQALEPGFRYFFCGLDACVAYVDTGGAWVAAGAPIASPDQAAAVAGRFIAAARTQGRRARFFAVEGRFAQTAPLHSLLIGEQPIFDPAAWDQTVRTARSLREQMRRARAKGVTVRVLAKDEIAQAGPTRAAIEALIRRWMRSRPMATMGFLVDVRPFDFPQERRYLVAELEGHAVGFLAAVPIYTRDGWFLEDLLREPAAPNGTAELLVDAAMRLFASEGARRATLGLAPLSGGINGWLRAARDLTFGLYNFHGVRAFKAKFRPQGWEPVYLAYPRSEKRSLAFLLDPLAAILAIYDSLAAFADGDLPRFGIETLLRAPRLVLGPLAALLLPWTVLLAIVDGRWFPAPWVRWAWVGFDGALFCGLSALAFNFRPWLATLLAVLVSGDALLTLTEAILFNVSRARSMGDSIVIALALLGPLGASLFLWHAREYAPADRAV